MTDDFDSGTFDQMVAQGLLPRIKADLIDKGSRFSNSFVTNAWCCPSRATWYSGVYSHCHGILYTTPPFSTWQAWDNKHMTLPVRLQQAGYTTYQVGKFVNAWNGETPLPNGWSQWDGCPESTCYDMTGYSVIHAVNGSPVTTTTSFPGTYQIDQFATYASTFIASAPQPFFMLVAPAAPHMESGQGGGYTDRATITQMRIRPPSRYAGTLRNNYPTHLYEPSSTNYDLPGIRNSSVAYNESDITDKPSWLQNGPNGTDGIWPLLTTTVGTGTQDTLRIEHLDRQETMRAIDDLVGTVIDSLNSRGVLNNTMIVFGNDNGWQLGEHRIGGMKMAPYEESIRVPLVIRIPGSTTARTPSLPVANTDMAETICSYAHTHMSDNDGFDLTPILNGQTPSPWRNAIGVEHWYDKASRPANGNPTTIEVWDPPDYRAIRTFGSHAFPNEMYIEFTNPVSAVASLPPAYPVSNSVVIDTEQYDLSVDSVEAASVAADGAYASARTSLSAQVQQLIACKAGSCQTIEKQ
jgi:arylsulfatase A-like enzyme